MPGPLKKELKRAIQGYKDQIRTYRLKLEQTKKNIAQLLEKISDKSRFSTVSYPVDPLPRWWEVGYHIKRHVNTQLNHDYYEKKLKNLVNKFRSYDNLHQSLTLSVSQQAEEVLSQGYSSSGASVHSDTSYYSNHSLTQESGAQSLSDRVIFYCKDTLQGLLQFIMWPIQYFMMPTPLTHQALQVHRSSVGSGSNNYSNSSPATVGHHRHSLPKPVQLHNSENKNAKKLRT